ncbi:MAG: hypothetical protein Kow0098_01580 [Ignavibacteriaceae bacterium]
MRNEIKSIKFISEWEELKSQSLFTKEIIILKLSSACLRSRFAEEEFSRWYNGLRTKDEILPVKLNVIQSKALSRKIESDLMIKHESPQLIWLNKDGSVRMYANHSEITSDKLSETDLKETK